MSGYVASARIVRGTPQLARASNRTAEGWTEPLPAAPPEGLIVDADAGPALTAGGLVERVQAIRERWSQLTFFLFDPNSWR
jgi:hypothetical protein